MMIDLIDRKKLIEELNTLSANNLGESRLLDKVFDIVENQAKVREWISVECETPTPFGAVLVQRKDKIITRGFYIDFEDEVAFWLTDCDEDCGKSEVIAWMPLPEPHKEGVKDE